MEEEKGLGIGTTLKISTPTSFVRDWVKTHYGPTIEKEVKQLFPDFHNIEFVCVTE